MQIIKRLFGLSLFFSFHFFYLKQKKAQEFLVKILKISCLIFKNETCFLYICKKKKQPKASILKSMGSEGFLEEK
jgi:hypothetical protein